ncbi:MAG TPA: hypothetical protein VF300_04325 [Methanothrix sp.]
MAKKAKHSDAVMTGILVTIQDGPDQYQGPGGGAKDTTRAKRCSAAKKVLELLRDLA